MKLVLCCTVRILYIVLIRSEFLICIQFMLVTVVGSRAVRYTGTVLSATVLSRAGPIRAGIAAQPAATEY